jgi:hypothetical protein
LSAENQAYLRFVTSVIAPLTMVAETGKYPQVLNALERMKDLIADLEEQCRSYSAIMLKEPKAGSALQASSLGNNGSADDVPPLERKWLSSVAAFTARQRSMAREIEILRALEDAHGVILLKRLQERLIALGLSEKGGQAAVVTQISRLKKAGLVGSEAQGFYSRTDLGAERLKKMHLNYATLFVPEDIRERVA